MSQQGGPYELSQNDLGASDGLSSGAVAAKIARGHRARRRLRALSYRYSRSLVQSSAKINLQPSTRRASYPAIPGHITYLADSTMP